MRIAGWRIALTGVCLVVLAIMGIGLASAAAGSPPANAAPVAAAGSPGATSDAGSSPSSAGGQGILRGLRRVGPLARLERVGRRLVHGQVTVTDKNGNLVTLQFDHGTIQAIAGGSITISEQGGSTVIVSTDNDTKVRLGRNHGSLADLKVGDELIVQSRVSGGNALAKHVLRVPSGS
jgi:Domain of unknown function (DUF5666)